MLQHVLPREAERGGRKDIDLPLMHVLIVDSRSGLHVVQQRLFELEVRNWHSRLLVPTVPSLQNLFLTPAREHILL